MSKKLPKPRPKAFYPTKKKKKTNIYNRGFNERELEIPYFEIEETHNKHINFELVFFTTYLVGINQKSMIVKIKKPPYHIIRPSKIYQSFRNTFTKRLVEQYPDKLNILTYYFEKHFPTYIDLSIQWGFLDKRNILIPLQGDIDAYVKVLIDAFFNAMVLCQKNHRVHKKKQIDDKYISHLSIWKWNRKRDWFIEQYDKITKIPTRFKKYVIIKGTLLVNPQDPDQE